MMFAYLLFIVRQIHWLKRVKFKIIVLRKHNPEHMIAVIFKLLSKNLLTIFMLDPCREVSNLNGVETLIHLLADSRDEAVANTCCVLTNMATEEGLRSEAQGKGVVTALLEPLKSQ